MGLYEGHKQYQPIERRRRRRRRIIAVIVL